MVSNKCYIPTYNKSIMLGWNIINIYNFIRRCLSQLNNESWVIISIFIATITAKSYTISPYEALSKLASFLHIAKTIQFQYHTWIDADRAYLELALSRRAIYARSHRFIYCATCCSCQNNANKINTLRHNTHNHRQLFIASIFFRFITFWCMVSRSQMTFTIVPLNIISTMC